MKHKKLFIALIIIFIITASVIASVNFDKNRIEISCYNIKSSKIPESFDGFRILQISDLHSKRFGKDNINLIKKADSIKPDIIAVTGDMINMTDSDGSVFISLAEKLCKKYKVYYINGNHELSIRKYYSEKIYYNYINSLKKSGVIILENKRDEIISGQSAINIYGYDLPLSFYKKTKKTSFTPKDITTVAGTADQNRFNILLAHNPAFFEAYSSWGADLTLSGHVHGGIIRLPFINGLLSPDHTFFPHYSAGRYDMNNSTMIVSRGLGNSIINIPRVLNAPELCVVTLKSCSEE